MPKSAVQKMHEEFDGITASKAPIIAGVSPWSSPYELFMEMTGQLPPKEQTFQMWLGTQIEGIVVRAFTRETGLKVRRPHRAVDPAFFFETEEYGFPMGALIDAAGIEEGHPFGVEAKNASAWMLADWQQDVPVHYMVQIQHQLACTGWSHFYAAAIVGNQFVSHRVERDEELITLITDKERDFYQNHLRPLCPPDVDGSHQGALGPVLGAAGRGR
jgi:putative phage-type endonuclease